MFSERTKIKIKAKKKNQNHSQHFANLSAHCACKAAKNVKKRTVAVRGLSPACCSRWRQRNKIHFGQMRAKALTCKRQNALNETKCCSGNDQKNLRKNGQKIGKIVNKKEKK